MINLVFSRTTPGCVFFCSHSCCNIDKNRLVICRVWSKTDFPLALWTNPKAHFNAGFTEAYLLYLRGPRNSLGVTARYSFSPRCPIPTPTAGRLQFNESTLVRVPK